ncbi:MAG: hypothetical protein HFI03_00545 [Lachnospiraceae bacterium]|jgi:hypothetical protein|nr:hypothetical protein [Lachnospiraceae bacterium]
MHNFKKCRLALLGCIAFLLVNGILSFCLTPITYSRFLKRDLKKMERAGEGIDLLFIGSSRVYRTYIPSVFEEAIDGIDCVINAGTSAQPLMGTYYYLKHMLNRYTPEKVMLGIDYTSYMKSEERWRLQARMIIDERLPWGEEKLEYFKKAFYPDEYIYFWDIYKNRDRVTDTIDKAADFIGENIRIKLGKEYWNNIDIRETEHYAEKGFVYTSTGLIEGNVEIPDITPIWAEDNVDETCLEYLYKIVDLCKEKNVALYMAAAPTSLTAIYYNPGYGAADRFFSEYAESEGIPYVNLNLLRNRWEIIPDSFMYDWNHVNGEGAERISRIYADILQRQMNGEDISEYVYDSVEQMQENILFVAGATLQIDVDDEGLMTATADSMYTKGKVVPEYRFLVSRDFGEHWSILQDYSESPVCTLQTEEGGRYRIRVQVRACGSNAEYEAFQEKPYPVF